MARKTDHDMGAPNRALRSSVPLKRRHATGLLVACLLICGPANVAHAQQDGAVLQQVVDHCTDDTADSFSRFLRFENGGWQSRKGPLTAEENHRIADIFAATDADVAAHPEVFSWMHLLYTDDLKGVDANPRGVFNTSYILTHPADPTVLLLLQELPADNDACVLLGMNAALPAGSFIANFSAFGEARYSHFADWIEAWTPGTAYEDNLRRTQFLAVEPYFAAISAELDRSRPATVAILTQTVVVE